MSDPLQRGPDSVDAPLWKSTSALAGEKAAAISGSRRARILQLLAESPATIFEIALRMELHDHQISGRFGELERDRLIEKTGERRAKPETGCLAEVYRLCGAVKVEREIVRDYPDALKLGEEGIFEREPIKVGAPVPGIPYSRRTSGEVPRMLYRVALVECEGCGRPVCLVVEGGRKTYRCGTPGCNRTWVLMLVNEPGKGERLALVMKHL